MDEKLINDLYNRAVSFGYKKTRDDFASLIKTNNEVYDDMFEYAQSKGLVSDATQFDTMIGRIQAPYKKKDQLGLEQPQPMFLAQQEVPSGRGAKRMAARPATAFPSEDGLSESAGIDPRLLRGRRPDIVAESTAPLKAPTLTTPQMEQREAEREAMVPKFAKPLLETITPELTGLEEQFAVPQLNYQFGDLGFKFEESGMTGDYMKATAPSGETIEISLDAFTSGKRTAEAERLRRFIRENTISLPQDRLAKIEQQYKDENKKFLTEEEIKTENKKFAEEQESLKNEIVELNKLRDLVIGQVDRASAVGGFKSSEEYQTYIANKTLLDKRQADIKAKIDSYTEREKVLGKAVGKYYQMKSEQGDPLDFLPDTLIRGTAAIVSGLYDIASEIAYLQPMDWLKSTDYIKEEYVKIAEKDGIAGPEKNEEGKVTNESYEKWLSGLDADYRDGLSSRLKDQIKKKEKKEVKDAIYKTAEYFTQTTKEYDQAVKENWLAGTVLGAFESIPSFFGGGAIVKTAKLIGQAHEHMMGQMNQDPDFDNVSEYEKMAVSLPVSIVVAQLEKFGFRNIVSNKGLLNKLAMAAIGKAGAKTTAKTFGELVKNEVESGLARGALTVVGGMLAEGETGAFQQVADLTAKNIYNAIKEKDMFELPKTVGEYALDILNAAAQESVGGFVLGMPSAVAAANRAQGYLGLDDKTFQLFESGATDPNIQTAFVNSLKNKVSSGEMTQAEAKEQLNEYRNAVSLLRSVPNELSTEDKKKAMNLLRERRGLENQIEGKDQSLVKPQQDRINAINQELTKLSEDAVQKQAAGEVPVQPTTRVSQEMAEGITEAGPEVSAAEGVTAKAEVAPTLTEEKVKSLDRNNIIELAKLSGVESNWDMVGEGDWLSGKKGEDAYVQRMLPIWNRARKLGNINPDSEITYRAKDDYVEAIDENGVAVGIIQMGSNGGILHLAVAPEFRGKGISKNLYTELKKNNPNANLSKTKNRSIGFEKSLGAIAISEAYNRSKQDGSNPELVKAVEDLLPTEAPVVMEQVEEPITKEYNNITIYNRAGKKININLNDLTVKKDVDASANSKWDKYNIEVGGNVLGYIETKEKGDDIQIALSGIFDPFESNFKYDGPLEPIIKMIINALDKIFPKRNYKNIAIKTNKGKGIGSKAYGLLAKEINDKLGKKLISDTTRSDAAEALWKSLEKKGLARVVGNRDGQRWAYYYEYIVPEAKEEVEKSADTQAVEEGASVSIGDPEVIVKEQNGTEVKFPKTPSTLSFVTESDKIDIRSLIKTIIEKKQKVWFWMADQLGRGNYYDAVIGDNHYLDAGPSFALDPENKSKGILWASGLPKKTLESQVKKADYIFFISGSPEKAKLFNRRVLDLIAERINKTSSFTDFKNAINSFGKETNELKTIKAALDSVNSFEELSKSPKRKEFLIAIDKVGKLKTMPQGSLKELLNSFNVFIDYNELRDGFYRDNDFKQNDIMLVGKPTGVSESAPHSTYHNSILGEVVGVPNEKIDSWDLMPESVKEKYKDIVGGREGKTKPIQTKVIAAETGVVRELEAQPTVREQKGVPVSNQTLMEEMESRAAKDERVKAIIAAAKKVITTLKSIIPNAQIYLHEDAEAYKSFAQSLGTSGNSKGLFSIRKDADGNNIIRIDINLSIATPSTVYHEVAHAIMYKAFGDNKKVFEKFRDQISSVLDKSDVEALNNFASLYKNESRAEEWLVQLSALMTDQGKNIPISTFQRIADIVNKLVSQLTKGKIVPFKESVSKKEVIDFFNQMIDSLRTGKEISISKTAEAAEIKEVSKAEVSQPVNELPGYDKLMDDVTNTLIPNALRRKLTGEEMIKMVKKFVAKSDIYKAADDIQRDELVRQVNGMLGEAYRNPPSAQRLLGLIQDPVRITMTEKQLFAKQIMDQARAAKNVVKVWMKTSQEMAAQLKKMAGAGRITPSQASAIIRRMSFVNMLDENSVNSFVDYVAKVFKNAEYAQQIANVRRLLRNAKRNAETKIGVANELKPLLRQVFAINPSLIPDNVFEKYAKLVEMMGERAAVLTLEDAADVRKTASEIMDAVNAELSLVDTLADVFNNYQDKVLDDDGKVMYSDTINKMVDAGKITTSDAEILRKYKSVVMPAEPATPMTDQQIADEKKQLEDFVMDSEIDETSLPSRDERDDARKLNALIKTAGVGSLTNTELKNLLKVIANINNGYFPHYAKIMIEKIEGANSNKGITKFLQTAKPLRISEVYSRIKKLVVRGKDAISLMVERNPIQYIEQIFGDFKTNTLKEALFDPIAKAFSNYESDYNKILNKIRDVENSLSKQFNKDGNKITMSKYKMMTYMLQLENDSNPGSKEVAPAMKFLNETIKEINTGKTNFTERDAEMLQEIATKFNDGAGNIDINKLYDSFSAAEKNAIKELQSINASLSDKAAYTANVIRGQKFTPLNNYIHHSVISKSSPTADATGASLVDQFNASRMPSTRAKSLLERTAGAKPISFDVLDAVSFAAKGQLIDYHLTSVIRTGRRAIDAATKAALEMGKDKRDIMNAIAGAYERAIETVLVNSYVKSTFADDVMRIMSRQGYRAVLAGTSRFISELVSNISFVVWAGRAYFIEGVSLRDIVMSADGSTIMRNLKSKMTNRVYSSDTQSGNFIDRNIMKQAVGVSGSRAKSDVGNKVNQIYSNTVKRASNFVEATADTLISTPDKIVMRPAWFGAFSIKFQELTGSKPDFEKIASNDEAYMVENQESLDQATSFADMKTTFIGATDNPFMGILKGTATRDQSAYAKVFNNFNGYMTRFLIYEYATARTAINAMVGNGQLSKSEGAALMAGVTSRMIVYSFLINVMGTGLMGMLLGDDDDEEETEKTLGQKFGQALSSAAVGLVLGRDFGNVTKNMVNYGVEKFNKEYLDFLRNGDYDPYKDAIAFSIIGNEKEGQKSDVAKILLNTTGALAPSLKTAYFVLERLARPEPKGEEAIERREKEFSVRLPLEVLGNLGMVPLYKDVRKVVLSEIYKDMGKKSSASKTKEDIKKMLLQGYRNREDMKRYDPDLYEETFGENGFESMMLPGEDIQREIKKEMERIKRQELDEMYDYVPKSKNKKSMFGSKGFGKSRLGSKRKMD